MSTIKDAHAIRTIHISTEILIRLVDEFVECINSKRIQSRIVTIEDLIKILWKRDILYSDHNIRSIVKYFPNSDHRDIIKSFITYLNGSDILGNSGNNYGIVHRFAIVMDLILMICFIAIIIAKIRHQNVNSSPSQAVGQSSNELIRIRHDIFNILCDNIDNWRDLGRCLEFSDVELNRIGSDHELRNDIKLITYRILEQAEKRFGNHFHQKLCLALKGRREDILRILRNMKLIDK